MTLYDSKPDPFSLMASLRMFYRQGASARKQNKTSLFKLASATAFATFKTVRSPIFIVGAPRSGTTFLGDSVGTLSEFTYYHEPPATKVAIARAYANPGALIKHYFKFSHAWLHGLGPRDATLVDKTPRNCFLIDFLENLYPSAKFVHIYRDGRDVAASNFEKKWYHADTNGTSDYTGYPFGATPHFWVAPDERDAFCSASPHIRCAWVWKEYTEAALESLSRLDPKNVLTIKYEDLASRPGESSSSLSSFFGLQDDFSREALRKACSEIHRNSIGKHRRIFSKNENEDVQRYCGSLLERLGYRL